MKSQLLIFAHKGEAQIFILKLNMDPVDSSPGLYKTSNEATILLITGEGVDSVARELPIVLKNFEIAQIINLGIAGTLDKELNIGEIIPVRSSYFYDNKKIHSQFYTSDKSSLIDCVTSKTRVLSDDYARTLSTFAPIVDMELWGIGKISTENKINFKAFKLISDLAGNNTQTFDYKKMAKAISNKLFDYYEKNILRKL